MAVNTCSVKPASKSMAPVDVSMSASSSKLRSVQKRRRREDHLMIRRFCSVLCVAAHNNGDVVRNPEDCTRGLYPWSVARSTRLIHLPSAFHCYRRVTPDVLPFALGRQHRIVIVTRWRVFQLEWSGQLRWGCPWLEWIGVRIGTAICWTYKRIDGHMFYFYKPPSLPCR